MAHVSAINICGIGYFRNFIKVFRVHVEELCKHPSLQITTSPKASCLYNQQEHSLHVFVSCLSLLDHLYNLARIQNRHEH